jgi:hypothetical protein
MMKSVFAVCAVAIALASPLRGDSIDTLSGWNGGSFIDGFGELEGGNPGATTFGQTFRLSANAQLKSVTFKTVGKTPDPASQVCRFQTAVMAWDGSRPTGSSLYVSQPLTTSSGFYPTDTFNVSLGDTAVNGGKDYIMLFTATNFMDGIRSDAMLSFTDDVYSGGRFLANYGSSSFADLSTGNWWGSPTGDVAMRLEYTPVPEPATVSLLALGGAAILRRRRQCRFK